MQTMPPNHRPPPHTHTRKQAKFQQLRPQCSFHPDAGLPALQRIIMRRISFKGGSGLTHRGLAGQLVPATLRKMDLRDHRKEITQENGAWITKVISMTVLLDNLKLWTGYGGNQAYLSGANAERSGERQKNRQMISNANPLPVQFASPLQKKSDHRRLLRAKTPFFRIQWMCHPELLTWAKRILYLLRLTFAIKITVIG